MATDSTKKRPLPNSSRNSRRTPATLDVASQLSKFDSLAETTSRLNGKSLADRAAGRFYTHELVGRHLACAIASAMGTPSQSTIRIAEPFSGDGRLVCWFIEEALRRNFFRPKATRLQVYVCDSHPEAVAEAKARISASAEHHKLRLDITAETGDTFSLACSQFQSFDVVLTNPPWENLKPDRRELTALTTEEAARYKTLLKRRDEWLAEVYPLSQPIRKFSGWGTNLARCGVEVALRLTRPDGVCGFVSPASLLADQMSNALRNWLFNDHRVTDVAYYVAEARLFANVDQPSLTMVARTAGGTKLPPHLTTYSRSHDAKSFQLTQNEWNYIRSVDYLLPLQFGPDLITLTSQLQHLTTFGDLESKHSNGLWAGRELDETGHHRFLTDSGDYKFTKGRMIRRFGIAELPSKYVSRNGPPIPPSADFYRLTWRDVSRPSQKRRVHATIIPPGWATGNSLHVAYFRDGDLDRLKALLGIVNSFVFEWLARSYLATGHLSLGVVRRVPIPRLDSDTEQLLAPLVARAFKTDDSATDMLEILVAQLYGLSHADFARVLNCFDKVNREEQDHLLELWSE